MIPQAKILIVDDTAMNIRLMADLLTAKGYAVITAASGTEAMEKVKSERPDLVFLDVVMPKMSGYEICQKIRENPNTRLLPVVMVTALDPTEERVKGLEAGADDFLSRPINQAELFARVRSLLRIKSLHDTVQSQAEQLAEWNKTLGQRVEEQVSQLERLGQLRRFISPQLAKLIVSGNAEDLLKSHRREICVVFLDIRGFTAFAETSDPEEVMRVLREYQAEMGRLVLEHEGTLERFTGDGMMVVFNDPVEVPNPEERAVRMARAMQDRVNEISKNWLKRGYELGQGLGIASGFATIGAIGFEGRWDYGTIGTVSNLAARLCEAARPGQILISQRFLSRVENLVEVEFVGALTLKGLHRGINAHNVLRLKG